MRPSNCELHDRNIGRFVNRDAVTTPASTLWTLSPCGGSVARMTSLAGMRTRTVPPTTRPAFGASSTAPPMSSSASRGKDGLEQQSASTTAPRPTVSRSHGRSGRLVSSSSEPFASSCPARRITRCVANRTTSSKSCVTRTIGMSNGAADVVDLALKCRRRARSTAANGSSSRRTRGSRANARATATRCRSPPDKDDGRRSTRSCRCTSSSSSSARRRRSSRGPVAERHHHVAECREVREQRVLLEHESDRPPMHRHVHAGRRVQPRLAAHRHACGLRGVQTRDASEDGASCRFPTGRRAPAPGRDRR